MRVLSAATLFLLVGLLAGNAVFASDTTARYVERPAVDAKNAFYTGNRAPLLPNPLIKLPVGTIKPAGWLNKELELQARGFHGHLNEISGFLKKEKNAWLDPEGKGEHGWEEPPYWLKGFINCGYILGDERMIAETKVWIEGAIRSQKPDGWFGPDKGRGGAATRLKGREDLWPNMIMLFCLQDYYEYTGDRRVITLMTNYCNYLLTVPEDRFLVGYWPKMRGGDLLFSVYWLYNRTGDSTLLTLAEKVHRRTADWTGDVIDWHNVNMSQAFGEPTTYYMQSKDPKDLEASYRNYDKIRRMYGQVPGGMFGGDENCRPGFIGPRQAVETCGMVEMMLSTETLTWITGDPVWADRLEDVAFNSLPAALTADLKALRYLTAPNMVLSDRRSKSPGLQNSGPMLLMDPHAHRCCQHNWGHGWPYYAQHLWFATPDNGLAAVLFSASRLTARVGDGTKVTIEEHTHYPFDEQINFVIRTPKAVAFPLYLRIPSWCKKPAVTVNGDALEAVGTPNGYIRIERTWSAGDTVAYTLPMKVTIRRWEKNHGSVSVDRGPLTYSLRIGEKYVRAGGTDAWPAWEIHPTTPWNYGLLLDLDDPAASFTVIRKRWPASNMPFTHEGTPIELHAKGKRIPQWKPDYLGLVGKLQQSPAASSQPVEPITLIPMGAARLRLTAFPVIGKGAGAHEWTAPPESAYHPKVSHGFHGDTPHALCDGIAPSSSNDHSIPRHTWWDHKGTRGWAQAEFDAAKKISRVRVYWFDDTGSGGCRVPASWRLLFLRDGQWIPVENASGFEVAKDRFNTTTFTPVMTKAVRLEVELKPEYSGGILELRLE